VDRSHLNGLDPDVLDDSEAHQGWLIRTDNMTVAQRRAARKNIKKAATTAKKKKTIAHLPKATRTALGKKGAKAATKNRK
jgi:hypothetical protein